MKLEKGVSDFQPGETEMFEAWMLLSAIGYDSEMDSV